MGGIDMYYRPDPKDTREFVLWHIAWLNVWHIIGLRQYRHTVRHQPRQAQAQIINYADCTVNAGYGYHGE